MTAIPATVQSFGPLMAMTASLGGAALMGATRHSPALRDGCAIAVAALQLACVLVMLPPVWAGEVLSVTLLDFVPSVSIAFKVDALGMMFALTASALWLLTTIYSIGWLRAQNSHAQTRFHLCFALTMTATLGVAFAANLLTLYLFYEAMTLATYFLVAHDETDEAYAGARKYVAYHLGTSIAFLLPAIILTYVVSGSFDFAPGGVFSAAALEGSRTLLIVTFLLFMAGSAKAAIMPLHAWLPSAMVAPVPVSALLHAVAVVNAGAFGVLRVVFDVFGPNAMQQLGLDTFTIYLASFTIVAASLYALKLDSLKALLAYSTIGQLSYIVLGAVIADPNGAAGGIAHIANHGVAKITLFLCAGSIYLATHSKHLSEMSGVGRQMPWTMAAFVVGALSMIGLPATAGFVSKWLLFSGAYRASEVLAIVALGASTLLSAAYYLRAVGVLGGVVPPRRGGGDAATQAHRPVRELSAWIVAPLLATAALTLALGLLADFTVLPLARLVVAGTAP
jgi:multicomponent Na+:H+ antiporter subunit D